MTASSKDWLSRKEAAAHLTALGYPVAPRTLARLAAKKRGPPYRLFMWRITAYPRTPLEEWARSHAKDFASDYGGILSQMPATGRREAGA